MSSPECGLTSGAPSTSPTAASTGGEVHLRRHEHSIIKTELGRTIMIQHDVISRGRTAGFACRPATLDSPERWRRRGSTRSKLRTCTGALARSAKLAERAKVDRASQIEWHYFGDDGSARLETSAKA